MGTPYLIFKWLLCMCDLVQATKLENSAKMQQDTFCFILFFTLARNLLLWRYSLARFTNEVKHIIMPNNLACISDITVWENLMIKHEIFHHNSEKIIFKFERKVDRTKLLKLKPNLRENIYFNKEGLLRGISS